MPKYSFQDYLDGFSNNDQKILRHFYKVDRPKVIRSLMKSYKFDEELVKDAFQNSMMEVFTRVRLGKVKDMGARFSTYFYGVCRNQLLKSGRNPNEKLITIPEHEVFTMRNDPGDGPEEQIIGKEELQSEKEILQLIRELSEQAGKNCNQVIKLKFEDRMEMKAIDVALGLSSGASRVKLSRCLKTIRERIKKNPRYRELRTLNHWGWNLA